MEEGAAVVSMEQRSRFIFGRPIFKPALPRIRTSDGASRVDVDRLAQELSPASWYTFRCMNLSRTRTDLDAGIYLLTSLPYPSASAVRYSTS